MGRDPVLPPTNLLLWTAVTSLRSYLKELPLVPLDVLRGHVLNLGGLVPLIPPEFDQLFLLEPGTVAFAFGESPYDNEAVELRAFREDGSTYVVLHRSRNAWCALQNLRDRYPVLREVAQGLDEPLVTLVDRRPGRGRRIWLVRRRFLNQHLARLFVELDRVAEFYGHVV